MKKVIDYLKDKIYYIMGGTVLIIVILIIISSCSSSSGGGNSYEAIEQKMVSAAKTYYSTRKNRLPKLNNGTVKVTISTLVEKELMNPVTDPKDSSNKCSGYVIVTKINKEYSYTPFLKCKGNYEPVFLSDKVKTDKINEYGAGVYEMNGEYVYRGQYVKNYVSFANMLWRIVKVDSDNDVELVLVTRIEETYSWDSAYNSAEETVTGVTTDYVKTDIRKTLKDYYSKTFTTDQKARIVAKDICVGGYNIDEDNINSIGEKISEEKECNTKKENEYIGLLRLSDFAKASIAEKCTNVFSKECENYNYLSNNEISTWTQTRVTNSTSKVFYIDGDVDYADAIRGNRINPVIYLRNVVTYDGKGTETKPYLLK